MMNDTLAVVFMGLFLLVVGVPIILSCIFAWKGDRERE